MPVLAQSGTALAVGDKLGPFQLLVPIGSGGMGRVWVAREFGTGKKPRLLAIKTTLNDESVGAEYWNVLLDEARIASQVQHPNVCSIHAFDVDKESGVPYLVMDWSDGGSLHELLEHLPEHVLPAPIAVYVAARVCDGLDVAHDLLDETGAALDVVHRDVSPQNILISASGQIRLTDFGVAKARGRLHRATETGEIKGKLSYMSPEQVTSKFSDRRADIFALGCVLYEASVGKRPFHGADAMATLYQLLEQPLALPSDRLPGYPVGLEEIVVKALQRAPEDRYQSAEEMSRALQTWLAVQGPRVSERDLSELVQRTLGSKIRERNQQIEATIKELDAPPVVRSEPTLSGVSSKPPANALGPWGRALALAALVATLAVVGAWLVTRHAGPTSKNDELANGPTSAALPTQSVGHTPPVAALVTSAAADSTPRALSPKPLASSGKPTATTKPRVGAMAVPLGSTHTLKQGELPTVVKKPPRTLDPNNPFADP